MYGRLNSGKIAGFLTVYTMFEVEDLIPYASEITVKESDNKNQQPKKKPNLTALVLSILAAGFGVQSDKNRERDFNQGSPLAFILGGFLFTLLFILSVALIVGLVLSKSSG